MSRYRGPRRWTSLFRLHDLRHGGLTWGFQTTSPLPPGSSGLSFASQPRAWALGADSGVHPPRFLDRLLVFRYGIMPRCFFNQITFAYSTYQINRSSTFDVQQHRSCSNGLINPLINPLRGDQMVVDQGWESVGPGTLNTDERNG
jgi:hypothetical protein